MAKIEPLCTPDAYAMMLKINEIAGVVNNLVDDLNVVRKSLLIVIDSTGCLSHEEEGHDSEDCAAGYGEKVQWGRTAVCVLWRVNAG